MQDMANRFQMINMKKQHVEPVDEVQASEIIKQAIGCLLAQGLPKENIPLLLADWTAITGMTVAGGSGVAILIHRMRKFVEDAEAGQYGGEAQKARQNESPDFAGLRFAMEHLLSHQGLSLDQAAASFVIYAVGLVHHHMGYEKAKAVLNTGRHELRRTENEAALRDMPVNSALPM